MKAMIKVIEELLDVGEETARLEKGAMSLLEEKSLGLSSEKRICISRQERERVPGPEAIVSGNEMKESLIPIINHDRNSENSWKVPEPVLPIPSNCSEGLDNLSREGVLYSAWGARGVKSARSLRWDWASNMLHLWKRKQEPTGKARQTKLDQILQRRQANNRIRNTGGGGLLLQGDFEKEIGRPDLESELPVAL